MKRTSSDTDIDSWQEQLVRLVLGILGGLYFAYEAADTALIPYYLLAGLQGLVAGIGSPATRRGETARRAVLRLLLVVPWWLLLLPFIASVVSFWMIAAGSFAWIAGIGGGALVFGLVASKRSKNRSAAHRE